MDMKQEIKGYLHFCEFQKKLSQKSIKAYSIDLRQFATHLDGLENKDDTMKSKICSYISELHATFSPKTAKRKLASLRAFFNYLEFEDIIDANPLRKIRTRFQEPRILPKTIPLKTIGQLLSAAHKEHAVASTTYGKFATLRDVAIMELLFATGMRVSELCSLKTEDVDLENGCIRIIGKGSKERVIQIGNKDVLSILLKYKKSCQSRPIQSGFFFVNRLTARLSEQSVRFMLQGFCNKIKTTTKITPHMFRHSFATFLLEEDVDIRYIQRMLGHSSIQTTQIYTQVTSEKQRQILTAKHPRNKIIVEK